MRTATLRLLRLTLGALSAVPLAMVTATGNAPVARASVSIAIPFEALVHQSTVVVFATPVSESSVWEAGRIITYTEMHVDTLVAGDAGGAAAPVWIRTLGGIVGPIGQIVEGEPSFSLGESSLLFLRSFTGADKARVSGMYTVTARAQGQFPVAVDERRELRVRRSAGIGGTMSSPANRGATLATTVLHGLKVTEATQAVVTIWGRLHAP